MESSLNRPLLCPKFIGRTPELATLGSFVEQAKGGQGHIVLIAGEAGIGKSRLVNELKTAATARDFLIVQAACFPADRAYPYAPVLELARSLFTTCPETRLVAESGALAPVLFPLLPDLISPPVDLLALPPLDPEQAKRRLEALLTQLFLSQAAQASMLLIVEDLHWSDTSSLDFLHYLVRRFRSHPILLLVTYRQDEMRPELQSWLAQLDRERLAQEIRLMPLSRHEVDTMLSAIFEERHTALDMRRFLHGEFLDTLYTLTEGNPFFVEEILSSLMAAGDIFYIQGYWNRRSRGEVSIPRSVQDSVQQRTAHVGEATRHVLTLAAVAGRHFDFALLQQLTRYDEHQLLLVMKELVSAQLVVEESADQFAFRHALIRRAIYTLSGKR
jgi:predicted ATPase